MKPPVNITLTYDEAFVLYGFFVRFDEDDDFSLRNNAEALAFAHISAQLDKSIVEIFAPDYVEKLQAARSRVAEGYEGLAPGVIPEK